MANARIQQIKKLKNGVGGIDPSMVSNSDVESVIKIVNSEKGLQTVVGDEIRSEVKTAYKLLDEQYRGLAEIYSQLCKREHEICDATKKHTSTLKDKAGQINQALARIENLVGYEFERKLIMLERFASVVDELDKLNKNGAIARVSAAMSQK